MNGWLEILCHAVALGVGATLVMDLWMLIRKRLFGIPALDYSLVGRWFAYLPRGKFRHAPIAASPPVPGERAIGLLAHHVSGAVFAGALLAVSGIDWIHRPTLAPALMVGIGSVAAPFLLMQPGMGMGIAARLAPRPALARLNSLATHAVFGAGLYVAGWAIEAVGV
ncbi:MAG: DUF2938 domain-containing protein [Pseudoxanthomonas sp.]